MANTLVVTIRDALHSGVCAEDGEVCCWVEEITPCAEVDLDHLATHISERVVEYLEDKAERLNG